MIRVLLTFLLLAAADGACAQVPLPWADFDYETEWRIEPEGRIVTVRHHAEKRRMRFELNDPQATVVLKDLISGQVLVLQGDGKAGVGEGKGEPLVLPPADPTGETRTLGGETCAVHRLAGNTLCMSADGVLMEVTAGPQKVTALRVIRKRQSEALFSPPEGAPVKPLPGGIGGGVPTLPF